MTFPRDTWAEAAQRRRKSARRAGTAGTLCALAGAGSGAAAVYFASEAAENWKFLQALEYFKPEWERQHIVQGQEYMDTARTNFYKNTAIGGGATLVTSLLAVGALRFYRKFRNYSSQAREARHQTRSIQRR